MYECTETVISISICKCIEPFDIHGCVCTHIHTYRNIYVHHYILMYNTFLKIQIYTYICKCLETIYTCFHI